MSSYAVIVYLDLKAPLSWAPDTPNDQPHTLAMFQWLAATQEPPGRGHWEGINNDPTLHEGDQLYFYFSALPPAGSKGLDEHTNFTIVWKNDSTPLANGDAELDLQGNQSGAFSSSSSPPGFNGQNTNNWLFGPYTVGAASGRFTFTVEADETVGERAAFFVDPEMEANPGN